MLRPGIARAASGADLKFVFVVVFPGWDTTRVFATPFDNTNVAMEAGAELGTAGGISFVDYSRRPSVRAFFEAHHADTLILNGINVPSVSHSECLRLALTGGNSRSAADWPARIAAGRPDYLLPHVVAHGPHFIGGLGGLVTRIGSTGYLEEVLTGEVLERSDTSLALPGAATREVIARAVRDAAGLRASVANSAREARLAEAYVSSLERAEILEGLVGEVAWPADTTLASQADLAVDLLSLGLSRCVSVAFDDATWDSHLDNDASQSANFETLFEGLLYLCERLGETRGEHGGTLADETVVVVLSEMGRTPQLNSQGGKDHWQYTSAMLVGPGITGDRVVGGFDDYFYGRPLDLASGETDDGGSRISTSILGATLLTLAGLDGSAELQGAGVIDGILA